MQLIIKKLLIIIITIISLEFNRSIVFAQKENTFEDFGLISIMYHRFNENKYPSTNIQVEVFKEQLNIIEKEGIKFINPKDFEKNITHNKKTRKNLNDNRRRLVIFLQERMANFKRERNSFYFICKY